MKPDLPSIFYIFSTTIQFYVSTRSLVIKFLLFKYMINQQFFLKYLFIELKRLLSIPYLFILLLVGKLFLSIFLLYTSLYSGLPFQITTQWVLCQTTEETIEIQPPQQFHLLLAAAHSFNLTFFLTNLLNKILFSCDLFFFFNNCI